MYNARATDYHVKHPVKWQVARTGKGDNRIHLFDTEAQADRYVATHAPYHDTRHMIVVPPRYKRKVRD